MPTSQQEVKHRHRDIPTQSILAIWGCTHFRENLFSSLCWATHTPWFYFNTGAERLIRRSDGQRKFPTASLQPPLGATSGVALAHRDPLFRKRMIFKGKRSPDWLVYLVAPTITSQGQSESAVASGQADSCESKGSVEFVQRL